MRTDKIESVNVSFLFENAPVKIIYIKLPVVGAFEFMNFQGWMSGVFLEMGELFSELFFYFLWEVIILN